MNGSINDSAQNLNEVGLYNPTITKSIEAIHFTVDPQTEMTLGAAKAFNAVNYLMQVKAHASRLSPAEYNEQLGDGAVILKTRSSEFMTLIGCGSRNFEYLKKLINELGKMRISWDNESTGSDVEAGFLNMFTRGHIQNNEVVLVIPPHTRNLLITEKPVAVIDFITLHTKINSKYGMAINDLIQQQMYNHDQPTKTFVMEDHVLRNALKIKFVEVDGVKKYSYKEPKELQRKVLDVAINDYNQAELDFVVKCDGYKKSMGVIYWTFSVESRAESLRKLLIAEMTDDILNASGQLMEFKVADFKRKQLLADITDEYSLQYLLYCIKLTKEAKNVANKAAYLVSIHDNNKEVFGEIWEVKKTEMEAERRKRAESHRAFIDMQKAEFKKRFIKNFSGRMAEQYNLQKQFPSEFQIGLEEHCRSLGKSLNAHEFLKSLNAADQLDFGSPVFAGFCASWVEKKCHEELDHYVKNQTITLPD